MDHEFTSECLWFCFNGILQSSLDEAKLYWNTHYIRPSRHETVAGVPNILFDIPEQFGGFDFRVRVPADKLQEVQVRYSQENENEFEDYFEYLMEFYELQYPSNYNEAAHVFNVLMRHAN